MINKKTSLGFNIKINEIDKIKYSFYILQKISEPIARILSTRAVVNEGNFKDFLDPKIKNLLPHPFTLKDCEKLCKILQSMLIENKKLGIIADYDVDGSSSGALIDLYLKSIGFNNFVVHIPNRINEGYGVSKDVIDKLIFQNCDMILSIDCGITAFEAIEYAKLKGVDFLVIDHHKQDESRDLPVAQAIVNPNRIDDESGLHYLCACGVLWIVLIGLNIVLEQDGYFKLRKKPDLMDYLDIVGIASVCDVMSMEGLNRAFYSQAMKLLEKKSHKGLTILLEKLNITNISNGTVGYKIGPIINAGGRLAEDGSEFLGYRLLSSKDINNDVFKIADKAIECNILRTQIEIDILESVEINKEILKKNGFIFVYNKDWHEGLVGIIASRLKDKYHVPTFVGFINEKNEIKMSARSVDEVDIGELIINAVNKGLLLKGGGHKKAGGLTIELKNVQTFCDFIKDTMFGMEVKKVKLVDSILFPEAINDKFFDFLSQLEPFGINNTRPLFLCNGFLLEKIEQREKFFSLHLASKAVYRKFRATVFRRSFDSLDFLQEFLGKEIEFIASVEKNNGYINIIVEDFVEN